MSLTADLWPQLSLGLPEPVRDRFETRMRYSQTRLVELTDRLASCRELKAHTSLCIYAAGSLARGDANSGSDVDLFYMQQDCGLTPDNTNVEIALSAVVRETVALGFPLPSNEGQYQKVLSLRENLHHLGSPNDDYQNHFTARMLLILESSPVYNANCYIVILDKILDSYLRDFKDHAREFRPIFLANDISRYWKTLCLNYEHRRNQIDQAGRIKQKIKNFKLGYSRLLTCFATIALLSTYKTIDKSELIKICVMTPVARLLCVRERCNAVEGSLARAVELYQWFLDRTADGPTALESYFSDRDNRVIAFRHARQFGDAVFEVVSIAATKTGTFRHLVV